MKILFITRSTVFSGPGGDTIQLLKTKEYLEDLGLEINIAHGDDFINYIDYDLIHFFNLRNPQDILKKVRVIRKLNIPTVISTIWGSYYECDKKARKGLQRIIANLLPESLVEYLKTSVRIIKNFNFNSDTLPYLITGHKTAQIEIAKYVDVLLPNSPTELDRVINELNLSNKLAVPVVNAVDVNIFDFDNVDSSKYDHLQGCLLCAARVEIRKCQLDLIKAVKGLPYKLVIVGKPSPNSKNYYRECVEEADSNVVFIEHVTQNELAALYKVAKAHALISWMETPGLSSLEAAIMHSNILVTDRGDTKFYFEDYATYCEPGNIDSIRTGIIEVMSKPYNPALKNLIAERYTWDITAKQTYDGYLLAIQNKKIEIKNV